MADQVLIADLYHSGTPSPHLPAWDPLLGASSRGSKRAQAQERVIVFTA